MIYNLHHAGEALFRLIKSLEFEQFQFKKLKIIHGDLYCSSCYSSIPLSKFAFSFIVFFKIFNFSYFLFLFFFFEEKTFSFVILITTVRTN